MFKRLACIIVMVFASITLTNTTAEAAVLKTNSTGIEVKALQTNLQQLGYNVGGIDGIFGAKTKAAVINFQTKSHLQADGIVGVLTRAALNEQLRQKKTNDIVTESKKYIGVSYRWGGTTIAGFDCSGFTQYVFKAHGITIPRVSRDQYTAGTPVSFANLQPGDLVFFSFAMDGTVSHVGIYLGGGQFINASSSKGVTIYTLGDYWKSIYVGAKRVY